MSFRRRLLYFIYQPYKWLIFYPFLFINTVFFGIVAVIVSSLVNQRAGGYWGGTIWSRFNALLTPMFVKVRGQENIQKNISYIVIPNHQSYWDIFLIYGWLGLDIRWVMKKELRKMPGIGFGSAKVGHIFLDRSNNRKAIEGLAEARKILVGGTSVVIFPEGTRSTTGQVARFKRGAFKLAIDLELSILPVTVINTRKILPNNSLNLLPGKVEMVIHKPVEIKNLKEKDISQLMDKVKDIIISGLPKE